jgi:opacity protein-like surface antigen
MSVANFVRTGVAALSMCVMVQASQAADLYGGYKDQPYYIPPPLWAGFYIGGHIGGAWSSLDPVSNVVFLGAGPGISLPSGSANTSGFFGGVQTGYNFQVNNFVYGIEADFGGLDASGNKTLVDPSNPARTLRISGSDGWYGDITGRVGFAYHHVMFYAKGGFAWFTGNVNVFDSFDGINQDSGTFTGWTIGGGVEYLIAPQWTIKAEYMYYDFGNNTFSCCGGATNGRFDESLTSNTIKVGFNYIFSSVYVPLN